MERYSTPSIEVRQIKHVKMRFYFNLTFLYTMHSYFLFLFKNDIILDLYIGGIEYINDLFIDVPRSKNPKTNPIGFRVVDRYSDL